MRLAKAPVAFGLTAALIIGGGIVAFADGDTSSPHSPPRRPPAASPASSVPASSSPAATSPMPTGQAPCGAATGHVLARVAGQVAERIYDAELHGGETFS